MFGAISRTITCRSSHPESRARLTKSREASENVWARIARAAHGHDVSADQERLGDEAADGQVGGDDDQHRERRDDEDDVREHAEELVDRAAAVAGGEPDRHPDQRRDAAAERADDEARAQPVDELGEDVLSGGGRAEPVLARRRLARREAELERLGVRQPRPDDREDEEQRHDREPDHELPVPEREVQHLAPAGAAARGSAS